MGQTKEETRDREEKEETATMVVGQGRAGAGAMGTTRGEAERRGLEKWGLGTNELWDVKGGARYTWGSALLTGWTKVLSLRSRAQERVSFGERL